MIGFSNHNLSTEDTKGPETLIIFAEKIDILD